MRQFLSSHRLLTLAIALTAVAGVNAAVAHQEARQRQAVIRWDAEYARCEAQAAADSITNPHLIADVCGDQATTHTGIITP